MLAAEYHRLCTVPSDIYLHLPYFVASVQELNAQHVIELGTRSGVSTVAWLHGLEQTGGRLTSIDLDPGPDLDAEQWTFIQGDDLDPRIVAELDEADIVFIDTSHHYRQTLAELNVYRHLVRPGGRMLLHDTRLPRPEGAPPHPVFPVLRAVQEFTTTECLVWSENPECWGLATIHVP